MAWRKPTLLLDAVSTSRQELPTLFRPAAGKTADIQGAMPHRRIRRAADAAHSRRQPSRDKILALGPLLENAVTGHHGAIAGWDERAG